MSFVERKIAVTFTLGTGSFGTDGSNNIKLTGLRTSAKIVKAGGNAMSTLQMTISGMRLTDMNQLSTLGMTYILVRRNTVLVEAGDDNVGMTTVFIGTITNAWADMQSAPDTTFRVEAHTGLIEAVSTQPPSSFTGATSVSSIMASLAAAMFLRFENSGVTTVLSSPYLWGAPREQVKQCADAAGINWIIDNGILAIWPRGTARQGASVEVSVATGMKGYPAYTSKGVSIETIYNPNIGYGGMINVISQQKPSSGPWITFSLDHDLEALTPNGKWFTTIGAVRPGQGPVLS